LPASTTKKALIRRYDRETLAGYVNPASFLQPDGVELLSDQGHASIVPYREIKLVAFVKEFEGAADPQRQVFLTRPKTAGLWVNLRFRDGGVLEGIIPNNLMQLEAGGFTVWRVGTVLAVLLGTWAGLATVRVTRGEEDAGRWELLLAGRVPVASVVGRRLVVLIAATYSHNSI